MHAGKNKQRGATSNQTQIHSGIWESKMKEPEILMCVFTRVSTILHSPSGQVSFSHVKYSSSR